MSDLLKEFSTIEGFGGVGVFTPSGESIIKLEAANSPLKLKELGPVANSVMIQAQKAALEMDLGASHFIHLQTEKAHILVRCLNEGSDLVKTQPGKSHIHLVLILKNDSGIGLAKLKIESHILKLAEAFRA